MKSTTKAAVLILIVFLGVSVTSCRLFFFEEPGADPVSMFDYLWQDYENHYGGFEERGVDWQNAYDTFRPQVTETMSDDELFTVITSMLAVLDDGHVQLTVPDKPVFYSNTFMNLKTDYELFDLDVIKTSYLGTSAVEEQEGVYLAYLYGSIGNALYLHLPGIWDNVTILNTLLDSHPETTGLIIDLRHNNGGNFTWPITEFTRLYDKSRLAFSAKTKNGTGPDDYTDWFDWYIAPGGTYFNKPVAVLIDRFTISAGERLVLMLKDLPNVTLLGQPTNGAIATKIGRELPNGWYYTLATQKVLAGDGINYEGTGIPPDTAILNTTAALNAGTDDVLDAALALFP